MVIDLSKKTLGFYFPFLIFVIVGGLHLLMNYTNGMWVLWFCENFDSRIYTIFSFLTLLGEPQVLVPLALLFFIFNYGRGFFVAASWFIASMITIALKGIIANHRPAYLFEEIFFACAGEIQLWYNLSTPSGHTTAAFAFFASLAITSKQKWMQFLFFVIALLTGLSRMVLFMHYFYDVYLGAIIGSVSAFLIWFFLHKVERIRFLQWKDRRFNFWRT